MGCAPVRSGEITNRRSPLEFALQLHAGTEASAVLASIADDEIDRDLHDRVVQTALAAPPHAPRSHTRWHWPDGE